MKNILSINKLNGDLTFYLDNNCDQIKDPFFFTEIGFETFYYVFRFFNLLKFPFFFLKLDAENLPLFASDFILFPKKHVLSRSFPILDPLFIPGNSEFHFND